MKGTITMGNIGEPVKHIELEPIPTTEPVREPSPAPATPAPAQEPVPA